MTTRCVIWHTGPAGASVIPSGVSFDVKKLLGVDGAQPQPPFPAYQVYVDGKPTDCLTAHDLCPACQAAIEAQYQQTKAMTRQPSSAPLSDARLAEIRALLDETEAARERLHGLMGAPDRPRAPALQACHDLVAHMDWQREQEAKAQAQIERLLVRNGELRDIVRVVAIADNSDSGVCYQLCRVRWYGGETDADEMEMRHDAPCVVEQARTALGLGEGSDNVTIGEASSDGE